MNSKVHCPECYKEFEAVNEFIKHVKTDECSMTIERLVNIGLMKPEGWRGPDHSGNYGILP